MVRAVIFDGANSNALASMYFYNKSYNMLSETGTSISIYAAQTCFSRSEGNKDRNGAEQFSQTAVRHCLLIQTFNVPQTLLWLLRKE